MDALIGAALRNTRGDTRAAARLVAEAVAAAPEKRPAISAFGDTNPAARQRPAWHLPRREEVVPALPREMLKIIARAQGAVHHINFWTDQLYIFLPQSTAIDPRGRLPLEWESVDASNPYIYRLVRLAGSGMVVTDEKGGFSIESVGNPGTPLHVTRLAIKTGIITITTDWGGFQFVPKGQRALIAQADDFLAAATKEINEVLVRYGIVVDGIPVKVTALYMDGGYIKTPFGDGVYVIQHPDHDGGLWLSMSGNARLRWAPATPNVRALNATVTPAVRRMVRNILFTYGFRFRRTAIAEVVWGPPTYDFSPLNMHYALDPTEYLSAVDTQEVADRYATDFAQGQVLATQRHDGEWVFYRMEEDQSDPKKLFADARVISYHKDERTGKYDLARFGIVPNARNLLTGALKPLDVTRTYVSTFTTVDNFYGPLEPWPGVLPPQPNILDRREVR